MWDFLEVLVVTLPKTNSSHLKIDGWKTILSFWDDLFFRGYVKLPGCSVDADSPIKSRKKIQLHQRYLKKYQVKQAGQLLVSGRVVFGR